MHHPRLIIFCGFAGAGKSTIAAKTSKTYRFPIFNADILGNALKEAVATQAEGNDDFASDIDLWRVNYDVLFRLIEEELSRGLTVILDNNMGTPWRWKHIEQLKASVAGLVVLPLLLQCPFQESVARSEMRARHDTTGIFCHVDGAFLQQHKSKYDFFHDFRYPGLVRIDATQPVETVWEMTSNILETWLKEDNERKWPYQMTAGTQK
jgi:predicted kinase